MLTFCISGILICLNFAIKSKLKKKFLFKLKVAKKACLSKSINSNPEENDSSQNRSKNDDQIESTSTNPELELELENESTSDHEIETFKKEPSNQTFVKCNGFKSKIKFDCDSIYSNFPFQSLDTDRESLKFVFENGVFHNINCAKKNYELVKNASNGTNRLCLDLEYHKHLQNIFKRGQISNDFSTIPHSCLTYNQLKKELDNYKDKYQAKARKS